MSRNPFVSPRVKKRCAHVIINSQTKTRSKIVTKPSFSSSSSSSASSFFSRMQFISRRYTRSLCVRSLFYPLHSFPGALWPPVKWIIAQKGGGGGRKFRRITSSSTSSFFRFFHRTVPVFDKVRFSFIHTICEHTVFFIHAKRLELLRKFLINCVEIRFFFFSNFFFPKNRNGA